MADPADGEEKLFLGVTRRLAMLIAAIITAGGMLITTTVQVIRWDYGKDESIQEVARSVEKLDKKTTGLEDAVAALIIFQTGVEKAREEQQQRRSKYLARQQRDLELCNEGQLKGDVCKGLATPGALEMFEQGAM